MRDIYDADKWPPHVSLWRSRLEEHTDAVPPCFTALHDIHFTLKGGADRELEKGMRDEDALAGTMEAAAGETRVFKSPKYVFEWGPQVCCPHLSVLQQRHGISTLCVPVTQVRPSHCDRVFE